MAPDPTAVVYPFRDNRGMSAFQLFVSRLLIDVFEDYFRTRQRTAFVGANQFFYYAEGDPRAVVEPDLYVVDNVSLHPSQVACWKTWEHDGKVPSFALEIASDDEYRKDYADKLVERYQQLGVRELVRYDPRPRGAPQARAVRALRPRRARPARPPAHLRRPRPPRVLRRVARAPHR